MNLNLNNVNLIFLYTFTEQWKECYMCITLYAHTHKKIKNSTQNNDKYIKNCFNRANKKSLHFVSVFTSLQKKKKGNKMNINIVQYSFLRSKYCPESVLPWRRFVFSECFLLKVCQSLLTWRKKHLEMWHLWFNMF